MADNIDRQKAIETAMTMCERCTTGDIIDLRDLICESLAVLPTADTDMSEYSDRLWKLAYERGKTEGIVRCKDCKHFHYDMPYVIQGIPVLGHEVCDFWGDGCKTSENGFCSYAERRTDGQT